MTLSKLYKVKGDQEPVNRPSFYIQSNSTLRSTFYIHPRSYTIMWDTYTFKGAPIWGIALTIVIPAVITYLSLYPGSRALRIGLLPIALMGMWITLWNYRFETRECFTQEAGLILADDAPLLELSVRSLNILVETETD